jgi:CheY-like chemotaxis protein
VDQNDEQPGRRPFVLVVEDHPAMQQTLVDILALGNIGALTADNGNRVDPLEQRPDLVLLM